ncbi:MAG: hypothetical protein VST68_12590 [Nitrospirota bacterium]|nr:hypothetical protein [Nitrospirota bacterium]
MIRARRLTHRSVFLCLIILIPAILVLGLVFRPAVPPFSRPDLSLLKQAGFSTAVPDKLIPIRVGEHAFEISVGENPTNTATLVIRSVDPLLKPDLLVYWVPETVQGNSLPEFAVLLGELMGQAFRRMPFPTATTTDQGSLVFYSLGHQEVFTQFPIPPLVGTRKGAQE